MVDLHFGLLASGNLGAECISALLGRKNIDFVLTDRNSSSVINLCAEKDIPCFVGNPGNRKAFSFISQFQVDIILSVNYLFIVESYILDHPKKYAINFHGSLLPKYRGRTPHVWSIINNEKETGITAHLMTEGCDEGDILYQEIIPIGAEETGADILNEYRKRYPDLIHKVIDAIENDKLLFTIQDNSKATYFGKRTPDDGEINWNWQKERIRNWVRAQAKPYPGAFTYLGGKKVIIHKIEYSGIGFSWDDPNGKILGGGAMPVIKTPNGAIILLEVESAAAVEFEIGMCFSPAI